MTTGDLKNNLRKLQVEVKAIKYDKDLNIDGLSKGQPSALLPLYHYVFLDYSRQVAQVISDLNVELSGKTDLRFVESMYKVLREVFAYKPPITKEQFFAAGFVERKVIMCTEILSLVKLKHRAFNPRSAKPNPGHGNVSKLGPRPASAASTKETSADVSKTSTTAPKSKGPVKLPAPHDHEIGDAPPAVQVVNELLRTAPSGGAARPRVTFENPVPASADVTTDSAMPPPVGSYVPRVLARPPKEEDNPAPYNPAAYSGRQATSAARQPEPCHVVQAEYGTPPGDRAINYRDAMSVEVVNVDQDGDEDYLGEAATTLRPFDLIAKTPAAKALRSRAGPLGPQSGSPDHNGLGHTLSALLKGVQDLNERMLLIDSRLSVVEKELPSRQESPLSAVQVETMLARMTLVEMKLAMVESQNLARDSRAPSEPVVAKFGGGSGDRARRHLPAEEGQATSQGRQESQRTTQPKGPLHPQCTNCSTADPPAPEAEGDVGRSEACPSPITPSPPATHVGGEPSPGRVQTSTPVESAHDTSASASAGEALTQAERIRNMLKETENLFVNMEVMP